MKKKNWIIIFLVGFWVIGSIIGFKTVDAKEPEVALAISPPIIDVVAQPGKSFDLNYKVSAPSDRVIAELVLVQFQQAQNGSLTVMNDDIIPIDVEILSPEGKSIDALILDSTPRSLVAKVSIPSDIDPGDYYLGVVLRKIVDKPEIGVVSVQLNPSVGSVILLTVSSEGNIEVKATITDLVPEARFSPTLFGKKYQIIDSNDSIVARLTVHNEGQNRIKPQGQFELVGSVGQSSKFPIIPSSILAHSRGIVRGESPIALNSDQSINIPGFFIGRYTLSTSLNFGPGTQHLFASTSLYALPFRAVLGVIVGVLIAVIVYRAYRSIK